MDQSTMLRLAKREMGLSFPQLAGEMGVSGRTLEKWASPLGSADRREMPLIARKLLVRLLDDEKRGRLAAGDRRGAETIDAIAAHLDPARLRAALRDFDSLQRAARKLAPLGPLSTRKPRAFANLEDKNAWQRQEEARNARRIRAASAGAR
jgi:transcriptional regulator with XRE-family HTH domain